MHPRIRQKYHLLLLNESIDALSLYKGLSEQKRMNFLLIFEEILKKHPEGFLKFFSVLEVERNNIVIRYDDMKIVIDDDYFTIINALGMYYKGEFKTEYLQDLKHYIPF